MSWTTRGCTPCDAPAVQQLFDRFDTREFGAPQTDAVEVQTLLARDGATLLVLALQPVGFAHVQPTGECDTIVDPTAAEHGEVRRYLLSWVMERGRSFGSAALEHWAAPGLQRSAQALQAFGFTHARTTWLLGRELTALSPPRWPPDVRVCVTTPAQLEQVWALVTRAFAGTPFSHQRPFQQWLELIAHDSTARAVWQGEQLVGCALTGEYLGNGHIRQLAVAPEHQGKGWGRALLLECFARDAADGHRRTTLTVDGANTSARALYDGVGMSVLEEYWRWDLAL